MLLKTKGVKSGVECQQPSCKSGVRRHGSNAQPQAGRLRLTKLFFHYAKLKVHPEICMKTKDRKIWMTANSHKERQQGGSTKGATILTRAHQKMQVHPEMLLKTNRRDIGDGKWGAAHRAPGFWLLTPVS
jgi:hypothetical protein